MLRKLPYFIEGGSFLYYDEEKSGVGPVDGDSPMLSSYRTELQGQIAILLAICLLAKTFGVTGTATTACDNQSTIRTIQNLRYPPSLKQHSDADADLVSLGRGILAQSSVAFKPTWVKGHADDKNDEKDLSFLEKLNIWMDDLADAFLRCPPSGACPIPTCPGIPP